MKAVRTVKILFLLAALFVCAPLIGQAQQTSQSAEITRENDRLTFMKSSEAPNASEEPSTGGLIARSLGAMLLIVGLIFFGAWGLKKFGVGALKANGKQNAPDLTILSSVSLGSGRTISTVRFGERVLLVGSTAQTFTLLADENLSEMSTPAVPRSVADLLDEENATFAEEFEQAQSKFAFLGEDGGRG